MVIEKPEVKEASLKYLFIEFDKFLNAIEGEGRFAAPSDIELFIEKSYVERAWRYGSGHKGSGLYLVGCDAIVFGTSDMVFDKKPYTLPEFQAMLFPILTKKVISIYGSLSDEGRVSMWDPSPLATHFDTVAEKHAIQTGIKKEDWAAMSRAQKTDTKAWALAAGQVDYIKERINHYQNSVLRFQMRKTMHHPLGFISYSTTNRSTPPPTRNNDSSQPIVINGEDEIESSINNWVTDNHRDLWFTPSPTGTNPKFGVVDIDFHEVSVDEHIEKKLIKDIDKLLRTTGHQTLIQFSGHGWHIWFNRIADEFTTTGEVKHYIRNLLQKMARSGRITFDANQSKMMQIPHVESLPKSNGQVGMFFGQHYKPSKRHPTFIGTGLVRTPVRFDEVSSFDKLIDAHPETVLSKFHELSVMVDRFFDAVGIGEGHEAKGLGMEPECNRSEHKDTTHDLAKILSDWKVSPIFTQLKLIDAKELFYDKSNITLTPQYDGWLTAIHYKERGGHKVGGKILKDTRLALTSTGKAAVSNSVKTVMCSKDGLVFWDNHMTREFEQLCQSAGLKEALFIGEVFEYDAFGKVKGSQAVTSALNRKVETAGEFFQNESEMRNLRFMAHDVWSIDNKEVNRSVPYSQRQAEVKRINGSRIKPVDSYVSAGDTERWLSTLWNSITLTDAQEGIVLHHEGDRYIVKKKYTLNAVIIGVNTDTKPWKEGKKTRHVFHLGVLKETKYGPTYVNIGTMSWGSGWGVKKQTELFDLVVGEKRGDSPQSYEYRFGPPTIKEDDPRALSDTAIIEHLMAVEPRVVVEVEYEKLGQHTPTFGFYYKQIKKAAEGKKLMRSGYRFVPKILASRSVVGPLSLIRIREDKQADDPDDITYLQAEGAGGFDISHWSRVKKNPIIPLNLSDDLNPIQRWFLKLPIVWTRNIDLVDYGIILDYNLTRQSFIGKVFHDFPISAPIEMYRKLKNIRSRGREYAGFVKDNSIYYGSVSQRTSVLPIPTRDCIDADFFFHTHPDAANLASLVSPQDIRLSVVEYIEWGVEWQCVVQAYGFDWIKVGWKDDSPLLAEFNKLNKKKNGPTKKEKLAWQKKCIKAARKDFKAYSEKWRLHQVYWGPSDGRSAFNWYLTNEWNTGLANSVSKNFALSHYFMHYPMVGFNQKKGKADTLLMNPGHGFRAIEAERATSAAGGKDTPFGMAVWSGDISVPSLPRTLKLEKEFAPAIARGKKQAALRGEGPLTDDNIIRDSSGKPAWKVFLGRQKGDVYESVIGLPLSMHAAKAEESLKQIPSIHFKDTLRIEYLKDADQEEKDAEIGIVAAMTTPTETATTDVSHGLNTARGFLKDEKMDALEQLHTNLAKSNPASNNESWNVRVKAYRKEFEGWKQTPEPRQPWNEHAIGAFVEWEVPLLEKGRLLEEAEEQFELSEREEALISQHYGIVGAVVDDPLQAVFGGLFEDEEIIEEEEAVRDVDEQ